MERRYVRLFSGAILSAAITIFFAFVVYRKGWTAFIDSEFDKIGGLLSAWASALAFTWLIVGYLQQGEELDLQRQELRSQREETAKLVEQSAHQTEGIRISARNTRLDTFIRLMDVVHAVVAREAREVIFLLAGIEYQRHKGMYGDRALSIEEKAGNPNAFCNALTREARKFDGEYIRFAYSENPVVQTKLLTILRLLKMLHDEALACDPEKRQIEILFSHISIGIMYQALDSALSGYTRTGRV